MAKTKPADKGNKKSDPKKQSNQNQAGKKSKSTFQHKVTKYHHKDTSAGAASQQSRGRKKRSKANEHNVTSEQSSDEEDSKASKSQHKVAKKQRNDTSAGPAPTKVKKHKKSNKAVQHTEQPHAKASGKPGVIANPLLSCISNSDMLTIAVGPGRQIYNLHMKVLACHSQYFRHLARVDVPRERKTLVWKEEAPLVVDLFVSWAYFKELDISKIGVQCFSLGQVHFDEDAKLHDESLLHSDTNRRALQPGAPEAGFKEFPTLVSLWFFAERYDIPALKNATIDKMHEIVLIAGQFPAWGDAVWAWVACKTDSKLRSFIIDCLVIMVDLARFNDVGIVLPNAMTTIFIRRLDELRSVQAWNAAKKLQVWDGPELFSKINLCDYHDHDEDALDCHGLETAFEGGKRELAFDHEMEGVDDERGEFQVKIKTEP